MDAYITYQMKPAPLANQQGRLDGSWIVVRSAHWGGLRHSRRVIARFVFDGRDACERWAHRKGLLFGVHYTLGGEVARG